MTEFSFPWQCTATGDGGPNSLSLSMVVATNQLLNNNLANSGLVYWTRSPYANLLAPSTVGIDTVRIASGIGIVQGYLYTNDSNVDFDINATPGNRNATDIIVLQRSLINQTVRLARISGPSSSKAVLTQTGAIWEVPIVDVILDGSGNLSSITDARVLAAPSGSLVKIEEIFPNVAALENEIIFTNIPPLFTHLRIVGRGVVQLTTTTTQPVDVLLNSDIDTVNSKIVTLEGVSTGSVLTQQDILIAFVTNFSGSYIDAFNMFIPNYSQPGFKSILAASSRKDAVDFRTTIGSFLWAREDIIHTVTFRTNAFNFYREGTQFVLYGIV